MEIAIIVWMYVVGLGITYSLLHEITEHWSGVVIVLGWPVLVPFCLLAKRMGWLDRFRMWIEMNDRRYR
jgi:hypothetical protein